MDTRVKPAYPDDRELSENPILFIDQLHQVDACDFHDVADAGYFAETTDARFFGDDHLATHLGQSDHERVGLESLFACRDQARVGVDDVVDLLLHASSGVMNIASRGPVSTSGIPIAALTTSR